MIESLRGLMVFAHVAETKSFSRAAERLRVTKSAVSKHVAHLEAELGVQLLVRTTRKLALTEAGERVYAASARIAGDVEAAHEAAQAQSGVVAGQLRITAPSALGRHYLMPLVTAFLAEHPQISVDLVLGDTFVDLVDDRIDVALRVGGRPDASLVTRRVAPVELVLAGSPGYLAGRGTPRTPEELPSHEWVMHMPAADPRQLRLRRGRRTALVRMRGRLACNDGAAGVAAARAGHGLIVAPDFELWADIDAGSLVRVLPRWSVEGASLQLMFPPRRHVSFKVRAFAEFVVEHWRRPPWQLPRPA